MMIKFKPRIYLNHDSVLVSEAILTEFFFSGGFCYSLTEKKDRVELILMRN